MAGREVPSRRRFLRTGLVAAAGALWGCRDGSVPADPDECDVCVIGSGFAGTHLALRTAAAGLSTLVVEAGATGRDLFDAFDYTNSGEISYPLEQSRMIAVGGTSNHWTGMVNRLRPSDFRLKSEFGIDVDWPIDYDELEPYYCEAEQALSTTGHRPLPAAEPPRDCDYPFESSTVYRDPGVRFAGRPLRFFPVPRSQLEGVGGPARLIRSEIPRLLASPQGKLLSGRQAMRLITRDGKTVDHLLMRTIEGREEQLRARCFVVAAGVVESARLLLQSQSRWFPEGMGNAGDRVGRYLVEHPTVLWRFRAPALADVPPGAHRTYEFNDRFRSRGLNACHFQLEAGDSDGIVWKMQPEMQPRVENRVTLSGSAQDRWRTALPNVSLGFSDRDRRTLEEGRAILREQALALGAATGEIQTAERWRSHPAGTCRMGFDEKTSVVDGDNRVFGLENLYVSGAAVFPNSGTSNPTLTVVAMTLRLAQHVVARLRGQV